MNSINEWPMVKLGDIQRKVSSINPAKSPDQEFSLYSIPAYDAGAPEKALGSAIKSNKIELQSGDTLLSKIVPHIRRSWIVDEHETSSIGSSEWIVYQDDRLDPRFLRNFFLSDYFHAQFMQTVAGVGGSLNRARPAAVAQISIPIPPLPEQQRIAEILDVSQQAKQNLHRAIQNYSALSSQLVETAVGKSEHNATLESLASISGGLALSKRRAELTLSVPYLRVANVFRNRIDLTEVKEMGCTPDEAGRTELRIGDILMTEAHGNRNEVGRVAMVDQPLENFSYQNHLFRIRGSGTLPPLVLTHLINSRFVHQQLVQLATTTSGLKTISISKARRLQIPILGEQEALDLNDQLERIRCLSEKTRKKLARVKELQDSLSTHAFAGQL